MIEYVKHLEELNFEKTKRGERKQKQVSKESESSIQITNGENCLNLINLDTRPGRY